MSSLRANIATAFASRFDSRRSPWSIVTATSAGGLLKAARQRAASSINAVESGPPETARTNAGQEPSAAKRPFASATETGFASSAADAFLLTVDALSDANRGARVLAQDFRERSAGGFLLSQRRERLPEPQERVGRLGGGLVLGRDAQERLGGVAKTLPLKHALAEPVHGLRRHPVA